MSELLSESYQNGIYWAIVNAEQARERAANAELDYWIKRAEKDGFMAGVERADGPTSAATDGIGAGQESTPNQVTAAKVPESLNERAKANEILMWWSNLHLSGSQPPTLNILHERLTAEFAIIRRDAEAMRDVILAGAWPMKVKIDAAAKLDVAKAKLLAKVPESAKGESK